MNVELIDASAACPLRDAWVLAYWRHMHKGAGKRGDAHGGWHPTRLRPNGRWQAKIFSTLCYPMPAPLFWTPILEPMTTINTDRDG